MSNIYPSGDHQITPNLGLGLWGTNDVVDENFILIDTAFGSGGTSVEVNGSVVNNPNFNGTTPAAPGGATNVIWQVSGSSVSAYVIIPPSGVFPVTIAAVASNWLNSYSSVTGLFTATQPTFTDLSSHPTTLSGYGITDAISSGLMTTLGDMIYENATPAPARLGGNTTTTKMYLSQTGNGVISAVPAWAQVAYADLSGTPQLPVTIAAVAHNFLTSYTSTTGVFTAAQPAVADLSDTPAANLVLAGPTTGAAATATFRSLVAADIPNLDAGKITTGVLALARGGNTFALLGDLIYGGASAAPTVLSGNTTATKMYLSQTGAAGPVSAAPAWAQINYADITGTTPTPPSGAVLWSALGNAGAALTLANAGYATTFNQTSAVAWLWANTTTGTSGTTNASPLLELAAQYYTGSVTGTDTWTLGTSLVAGTNGASTLTIGHSGSTGNHYIAFPQPANNSVPTIIFGTDTTAGISPVTSTALGGLAFYVSDAGSGSGQISWYDRTTQMMTWLFTTTGISQNYLGSGGGSLNFNGANATGSFGSSSNVAFTTVNSGFITLGGVGANYNFAGLTAGSQYNISESPTFKPAYGVTTFAAHQINPTINQAAVTDTIAGVQVTGGNLVTLVFADTTATFTNGATTLTVAAVTNTTVNGSGNTIASYVRRTGITVVTNSAESAGSSVTLSMANTGSMATNDYVSISGLTVATWLNGKVVKLTGVSANVSITFADPTGHGTSASQAEGGGVVICHYLTYSKTISNITLGSDTGTATQQATGAYTALQIAVTETALGGTPNYLINALAGAAGTTQVFAVDNLGAMYLAKAAAGAPTSVGTAGTLGQIVRYGGVLYFCSVTGAAGSATWNSLNMTAV